MSLVVSSRARFACLLVMMIYAPLSLGCSDDAATEGDAATGHDDGDHCSSGHDHDHDHDEAGDGGDDEEGLLGEPTGATCPTGSKLTWDNFGEDFMTKYCTRCHARALKCDERMGAPLEHDFDWQNGVLFVHDHVDRYAGAGPDATNTIMPPDGAKPTLEERKKLSEWIACGVK